MLKKLFGRKKKAIVFVDYEYWFYSYKNMFSIRPEPVRLINTLKKEFDIADVMVFADFSVPVMSSELRKLRSVTNTIIETGNTLMRRKKDMTDFVMLDYIYRNADSKKSEDTYIIFSGDGHFQSVVRHLTERKKKNVIVYGIKDTVSRQLQDVASEVRFLPTEEDLKVLTYRLVATNMAEVEEKPNIIPTFKTTVSAVTAKNGEDADKVRSAVEEMLDKGYLFKGEKIIRGRHVKTVNADWDKMISDGIINSKKELLG